jgi:hypothetical protein
MGLDLACHQEDMVDHLAIEVTTEETIEEEVIIGVIIEVNIIREMPGTCQEDLQWMITAMPWLKEWSEAVPWME